MNGLRAFAKTFWIGGMWVIGIVVAPVLFDVFANDRATAGMVAGRLFQVIAWIGMVAGLFLLIDLIAREGVRGVKQGAFWLILGMLACTMINHFGVTPIIANLKLHMNQAAEGLFGGGFATWHAISSLIYLVQSLLGLAYIVKADN